MTNTTSPPGDNQPDLDLSSPVTVLPLAAALITIVATLVGACFVYHRRQRKRTQDLVRQLRVTERRIDAIGMLTAKKQQALAARKADYNPPAAAPCSSCSTLGITNIHTQQPLHMEDQQPRLSMPSSTAYSGGEKTFTVKVHMNPNTTDESVDSKVDMNDASYYCSTCKESVNESVFTQYRAAGDDLVNSSMAVECATIPAVSSLSTIFSTANRESRSHKVHSKMTRSQSELQYRNNFRARLSKQSISIIRGLGLAKSPSETTKSKQSDQLVETTPVIIPSHSTGQDTVDDSTEQEATSHLGVSNFYAQSESELPEVVGRPNTPVQSRQGDSSAVLSVADCTTDTEGVREKWV